MKNNIYDLMMKEVTALEPKCWEDLSAFLQNLRERSPVRKKIENYDLNFFSTGIAFLTYDYGIDGISIEISKYAKSLETLFPEKNRPDIHLIGGDFQKGSAVVLLSRWKKFRLFGANGWEKWDRGKWFKRLFMESWNMDSTEPNILSQQTWKMSMSLIERLGHYINQNKINLFIPVNIFSFPGNLAFSISVIIVSEFFGVPILNLNHDFYWEGGKPSNERKNDEPPGKRDHFFRNYKHKEFFKFFKTVYPWNGKRCIQVNIKKEQSGYLIENLGFEEKKVYELSTSLSESFFEDFSAEDIKSIRERMAYIFSDGNETISPKNIEDHLSNLKEWMKKQKPVVCAGKEGLTLDLTKNIVYFLQPTRIIARKRIEKDIQLIKSLINYRTFANHFKKNSEMSLFLHISGPVSIEHEDALKKILLEFKALTENLDDNISDRIFLGFSVGAEDHRIFQKNKFKRLSIEDIYHLADLVLFPSESERRGLPIIESSASKVPIICCRFAPTKVFDDVIGEKLDPSFQIKFIPFPEEDFSQKFLKKITSIILDSGQFKSESDHNREAVRKRFGAEGMKVSFEGFLHTILSIIQ